MFRILGTWLLGLGLVLLIVDGTRSLGDNMIVLTPLADIWSAVHGESFAFVLDTVESWPDFIAEQIVLRILGWPGWAVFGVPGLICAFLGRSRRRRINQFDQI